MELSEIISQLRNKEAALREEFSQVQSRLEQVRKLSQTASNLEEKILSIGFAINRLEDIKEDNVVAKTSESAWGDIDE